jgi:hypothetical protein
MDKNQCLDINFDDKLPSLTLPTHHCERMGISDTEFHIHVLAQGFFPNANLPANAGFSSPLKFISPQKIGPSSLPPFFIYFA